MIPLRRLALALALASALGAASMIAAPAASAAGKEEDPDARSMTAPNLVVPVVQDGKLVNYLFVEVRVELAATGDIWRVKERSHFLRDALIRAAHRGSLATQTPRPQLDQAAAVAAFTAAAQEALGARAVRTVSVQPTGALQR